jgi:hypothetical protein
MQRLSQTIELLTSLGQLALVGFLLLIAREIWKVFAWTGIAQ